MQKRRNSRRKKSKTKKCDRAVNKFKLTLSEKSFTALLQVAAYVLVLFHISNLSPETRTSIHAAIETLVQDVDQ